MGVIDRIIKESTMDQSLIAQKFRELADLFDSFDKQVAAAPKALKVTKPVPTESVSKIEIAADNDAAPTLDDLRQGMAELIGSGKRDKVIAILAKLGVKKVSEIDEDKFAEAMDLINGAR
jgi:hypothetical protein